MIPLLIRGFLTLEVIRTGSDRNTNYTTIPARYSNKVSPERALLKWVTNKRDICYHIVARDLSARPHEILGIKIRDVVFKNANNYQYAEILVNGKTGSRQLPLIQSIPYVKDWLSEHPSRNNPNSRLFVP